MNNLKNLKKQIIALAEDITVQNISNTKRETQFEKGFYEGSMTTIKAIMTAINIIEDLDERA